MSCRVGCFTGLAASVCRVAAVGSAALVYHHDCLCVWATITLVVLVLVQRKSRGMIAEAGSQCMLWVLLADCDACRIISGRCAMLLMHEGCANGK
jgi:hypothetical protein